MLIRRLFIATANKVLLYYIPYLPIQAIKDKGRHQRSSPRRQSLSDETTAIGTISASLSEHPEVDSSRSFIHSVPSLCAALSQAMRLFSHLASRPALRSCFQPSNHLRVVSRSYAMGHSVPPVRILDPLNGSSYSQTPAQRQVVTQDTSLYQWQVCRRQIGQDL